MKKTVFIQVPFRGAVLHVKNLVRTPGEAKKEKPKDKP